MIFTSCSFSVQMSDSSPGEEPYSPEARGESGLSPTHNGYLCLNRASSVPPEIDLDGVPVPNTHQPLCRTPCVDLGSEGPPDPPSGEPSSGEALREYQSKLEFALKLGYAEELVRLVLAKLGPYTLINDILGELVKLGRKVETNQQLTGSTASQPTPSSSYLLLGDKDNLRPVVLDGSNVAMSHLYILAVDWFLERGHRDITVFVPSWKKEQSRPDALITDQDILRRLEKDKILVFTPSRRVQGRRVVCYDDRFIVKLAYESDGIIVSNDNYRDLASEKPEWKKLIDERLLMYSFVNDKFMPPDDPLGRHGPSLENFLRKRPIMPEHKKQPCPYGGPHHYY
uniref:Uncharacterized protein n=1 Tax=Oncorhynchus tshawytscha TaxID=74940 RepID=A0AAZ3QS06_ONCTS